MWNSARRAGHVGCVFYFFDFDSRVMFIYFFLFLIEVVVILANLMCFSLCFRVGFSCSFFASSFVFVVTLNHVREGCSFDCGC